MIYSFVRNDETSFSSISRIYEVYRNNKIITCLVIGIDYELNKYFVTILGDNILSRRYDLEYDDISTTEFIAILYEFLEYILPLSSYEDFVSNEYLCIGGLVPNKLGPVIKDNFVFYSSSIEPYYNEDLVEYDGVYALYDPHTNFLLDEGIITPTWIEDCNAEEYMPYTLNNALDIEEDFSIYSKIDFDLLEKEYKIAKEILK